MIERDYISPGRSAAIAENGMAATSHPLATVAALDILRAGGSAMDGAIAAVAVQSVVDPLMTGIGGDCFALIAPGDGGPVSAFNGSGFSPAALTPDLLAPLGLSAIPDASPHAVTVPGAVDAWCRLHAAHGRIDLAEVLRPAIIAARDGFRITGRVARDWNRYRDLISWHAPAKAAYLPGGSAPRTGDRMAHPALAQTLTAIAERGPRAFYEGPVADEIASVLKDLGGVLSTDDLADYAGFFTEPIAADYRGRTVFECPPNGQGLAALLIMRILDGFDLSLDGASEADRIHLLAEATRVAYRERDLLIADPAHMRIRPEDVLSEAFVAPIRNGISLGSVGEMARWSEPVHSDTVCLSVVDRDRNAVSLINSLFDPFGSGIYAERSGVLLHNRGCGFSLAPGHPNRLGPRKRPLHTIIPAIMRDGTRGLMPFSVMGGHYQATGHAHFLSQMFDRNLDPQLANEMPRSFLFDGVLDLEFGIGEAVRADLEKRGHRTRWSDRPLGGCQAIYVDQERGVLIGSSDHRKDGIALGY